LILENTNIEAFNMGRKIVFVVVAAFACIGIFIDTLVYYNYYSFNQIVLNGISLTLCVITLVLDLTRAKVSTKTLFVILAYTILLSIVITHVFYQSFFELFTETRTNLFLRDTAIILCFIFLSGLISGRIHIIIQAAIYSSLTLYYSFVLKNTFIYENIAVCLLLVIGFSSILFFVVTLVNRFIDELGVMREKLDEQNQEISSSIQYAEKIQHAILPSHNVINTLLPENFIFYKPKEHISGVFYWINEVYDEILFAVGDCKRHGVSGAILSVVFHNSLDRSVREFKLIEPGKILDKTSEMITNTFLSGNEQLKDGMDIALCSLNTLTRELNYAGANNPIYYVRNNQLTEVFADRQAISVFENQIRFKNQTIQLKKGDTVYLFTYGFIDQFGGEEGTKFNHSAFKQLILNIQGQPMDAQKKIIMNTFDSWKRDQDQLDDVCIMGIEIV
jgi:serine phosphatase RsbU (regulator of sigma subunit)